MADWEDATSSSGGWEDATPKKPPAPKVLTAPVKEEPVYEDVIVQRTPTQTKTPGLFAGEESKFDPTGKGLVGDPTMRRVAKESAVKGALGVGGELESVLRSVSPSPLDFLKYAINPEELAKRQAKPSATILPTPERVGELMKYKPVPEAYKPAAEFYGMAGEQAALLGGPKVVSGIGTAGKKGVQLGADLLGRGQDVIDLVRQKGTKQALGELSEAIQSGKIEKEIIPQRGVTPEEIKVLSNTIQNAPTVDTIGENMILKPINQYIDGLKAQRAQLAAETYGTARQSMDSRYAAGDFWQTSEPGRKTLASLESKLKPTTGLTEVSVAEETEIRNILRDLKGKEVEVPASRILTEAGEPVTPAQTKLQPTSPDVLRETLRKLRDRSNGSIVEGYGAISQQRAKSLADELAKSLGEWDGTLAKADKLYREQSELLHPAQTRRGKTATAREKFDITELSADPKTIPAKFFNSRQGVEQFTDLVGGNRAIVENAAENFVNNQLRGKTPDQMRTWLNNNKSWLDYDTLPSTMQRTADKIYRLEYASMREPIATLASQIENNLIASKDIPSKLREVLKTEGLPKEPVKRIAEELTRIDQLADKEKAYRDLVKKIAGYGIGGTLVGYGVFK